MPINCAHMLLDLLFKQITNVSVLLYGEIRCVKNVSIIIIIWPREEDGRSALDLYMY